MSALACEPLPTLDRVLDRVLEACPLDPERGVCVAGDCAVDIMGGLCRRGFRRVEFARRATCSCADERCETLLVAFVDDPAGFTAVLARTTPLLHADGLIVMDLEGLPNRFDRGAIRMLLRQAGFADPVVAAGHVMIARKLAEVQRAA